MRATFAPEIFLNFGEVIEIVEWFHGGWMRISSCVAPLRRNQKFGKIHIKGPGDVLARVEQRKRKRLFRAWLIMSLLGPRPTGLLNSYGAGTAKLIEGTVNSRL